MGTRVQQFSSILPPSTRASNAQFGKVPQPNHSRPITQRATILARTYRASLSLLPIIIVCSFQIGGDDSLYIYILPKSVIFSSRFLAIKRRLFTIGHLPKGFFSSLPSFSFSLPLFLLLNPRLLQNSGRRRARLPLSNVNYCGAAVKWLLNPVLTSLRLYFTRRERRLLEQTSTLSLPPATRILLIVFAFSYFFYFFFFLFFTGEKV